MTKTLSRLATCTAALITAFGSRAVLAQAHAAAKEVAPCSLFTLDQIKTLIDGAESVSSSSVSIHGQTASLTGSTF